MIAFYVALDEITISMLTAVDLVHAADLGPHMHKASIG